MSAVKSEFATLCRSYRVAKGLKQREVAEYLEVKPSSYGNVESSPHKVIRREKAERLVLLYEMNAAQEREFLGAWDRCPLSAYGQKQKAVWERRNRMRSKAKHHDRLFISLVELLGTLLPQLPPDRVCSCPDQFGQVDRCEVCEALYNLGLNTYTTTDQVIADLSALQTRMELKAAAGDASG